jgi:hypothetical protein
MRFSARIASAFLIGVAIASASVPAEAELRCDGERFEIQTTRNRSAPYIELAANERKGAFLLDYGTTLSSVSRDVFRASSAQNSDIDIENFSLPSFGSGHFGLAKYWISEQPAGGQIGIIGTDFLSLLTADFSFRNDRSDVVLSALPCDPEVLRKRGMIAVRQTGFFSSNLHKLAAGTPNVPVLYLDIGGVRAPAQIDTGYDDAVRRPSIDINEALYDRLSSAGVRLEARGGSLVATCSGIVANAVYATPETKIFLTTREGVKIREIKGASLVRKVVNGCGGIADMRAPEAQLGVTIVSGLGSLVFDPRSEIVWVPSGP